MKRCLLLALAALPLVACGAAPGDDTELDSTSADLVLPAVDAHVDFDSLMLRPPPFRGPVVPVANGSVVDTTYSGLGVTFSSILCTPLPCVNGSAYAQFASSSGNNAVSLWTPGTSFSPGFNSRFGAVRADFATPRSWVSIDAHAFLPAEGLSAPAGMPWLEAYDANNALVGKVLYPAHGAPNWGTWLTLRVDAPSAVIAWVRFSSRYVAGATAIYGEFDNLRFNGDPIVLTPIEKPIGPFRPVP